MLNEIDEALNLTYLPRPERDGIGTFPSCHPAGQPKDDKGEVVKASSGHYPLPFLISSVLKELPQR